MDFIVVHEIEGLFSDGETVCRGRMRCRSGRRLSMDEAEFLASAMDAVDGVLGVSVNPRIGSVLCFYRDRAARRQRDPSAFPPGYCPGVFGRW